MNPETRFLLYCVLTLCSLVATFYAISYSVRRFREWRNNRAIESKIDDDSLPPFAF